MSETLSNGTVGIDIATYQQGYAAGVAAERERCLADCHKLAKWYGEDQAVLTPELIAKSMAAAACYDAIRARRQAPAAGDGETR